MSAASHVSLLRCGPVSVPCYVGVGLKASSALRTDYLGICYFDGRKGKSSDFYPRFSFNVPWV